MGGRGGGRRRRRRRTRPPRHDNDLTKIRIPRSQKTRNATKSRRVLRWCRPSPLIAPPSDFWLLLPLLHYEWWWSSSSMSPSSSSSSSLLTLTLLRCSRRCLLGSSLASRCDLPLPRVAFILHMCSKSGYDEIRIGSRHLTGNWSPVCQLFWLQLSPGLLSPHTVRSKSCAAGDKGLGMSKEKQPACKVL